MSIVREAIVDAKTVSNAAEERAKDMFAKEFSPKIKSLLSAVINESTTVSTGSDQPGGYGEKEDLDAVGKGVASGQDNPNINNQSGDGPQVGYPAAKDVSEDENLQTEAEDEDPTKGEDDEDRFDEGYEEEEDEAAKMPGEEEVDSDDEEEEEAADPSKTSDLDYRNPGEEDDVLEIVDDVPSIEDEPEGGDDEFGGGSKDKEDVVLEYRKRIKKLSRENKVLREAVQSLRNSFRKVDLFNAKLAYAYKLMTRPGLSRGEKKQIAEAFDAAKTVREAKIVYSTIQRSLATRKPVAKNNPLQNRNVKTVISEQTKMKANPTVSRLEELTFGFNQQ